MSNRRLSISTGNPARSRRGLPGCSWDRRQARTQVTVPASAAKAAPPMWNREVLRRRRRHTRRNSRSLPPASRQDVDWKATRACRLSPKAGRASRPELGARRGLSSDPYNPFVLARAGAWLDRAAFNPQSLPDDVTIALPLAGPVAGGARILTPPRVRD